MISVNIICVGGLKEDYWRKACAEYEKRLSKWCRIGTIEIPEERLPENPGKSQIAAALDTEADKILARAGKSYLIALCVEGQQMTSTQFAQKLSKIAVDGASSVALVIGSSFGLSQKIKEKAGLRFSMSELTFPHQLARVMLFEQLYRAFNIIHGGKYHK